MNYCYLELAGGLGNQLFEIAAGYAHTKRTRKELIITNQTIGGRPNYWQSYLHKFTNNVLLSNINIDYFHRIWEEPHFHYCPIPRLSDGLRGYFQSSKYFEDISSEIRELFQPTDDIKRDVREKYADILAERSDNIYCVLHIRRGDYLLNTIRDYYFVCDKSWYVRAINNMISKYGDQSDRIIFLVFSDDLEWCMHIDQSDMWKDKNVKFINETNECYALYLMSQFNNYIISNSSFSWWAIYLSKCEPKTVIAPSRWFGPTGPQDFYDIYEPGWILL